MTETLPVDAERLRKEVRVKYREVATAPKATYHFHTGRVAVERLRYDMPLVDSLPERAVEYFAPGVISSSPISPTASRFLRRRYAISTCGPAESPVACRAQVGKRCSRRAVSSTSVSVSASTRSEAPAARRRPGPTRCSGTR